MNYDDIVFEDNDDDSWSALTEDVSNATHGTPFSPVVFGPKKSNTVNKVRFSEMDHEEGALLAPSSRQNNSIRSMNDSDAAKAMLSAIQVPQPKYSKETRRSQNPRGTVLSINSPKRYHGSRKPQYNEIGFGVDNRARTPGEIVKMIRRGDNIRNDPREKIRGENRRNSSNMGYLPSRHFQLDVDKISSSRRPTIDTQIGGSINSMSQRGEQENFYESDVDLLDIESPSNESQNTTSTMRSTHTISSARSRRTAVSHHSSTSLSILHGEVINLEGNLVFAKNAAHSSRHHSNLGVKSDDGYIIGDQSGQQGLHLSGMEIGADSPFNFERKPSGGHSFMSSHGFSSIGQEKYQSQGREPVFTFGIASERILNAQRHATKLGHDAKKGVAKMKGRANSVARQIMSKYYRPPLSPRSRELQDLEYLQQSHKDKFNHLKNGNENDEDSFFDFVIVLTPQESYEYWANILDFREEYLPDTDFDTPGIASTNTTDSSASAEDTFPANNGDENYFKSPQQSYDSDENLAAATPLTGLLRRKSVKTPTPSKGTPSRHTSRQLSRYLDSHQKSRFSQFSRSNLLSPFEGTPLRKGISRLSMFERAIQSPTETSGRSRTHSHHSHNSQSQSNHTSQSYISKDVGTISETPMTMMKRSSVSTVRRRFGNRAALSTAKSTKSIGNVLSPPVRSLKRDSASAGIQTSISDSVKQQKSSSNQIVLKVDVRNDTRGDEENENPNRIQSVEDMPNPKIPRGFAIRRNGMMKFLSALQKGIVLRRHCPNKEAMFCKLSSDNGGDTIMYQMIDQEEAMAAFKSQRVQYNRNFEECTTPTSLQANCADWSLFRGSQSNSSNKFVPDHVASQKYREKFNREHGVLKRLFDVNSGSLDARDIVALHPATKVDRRKPGSETEELGTATLRRSLSKYDDQFSFSLITAAAKPFIKPTATNLTDTWQQGEGSEHLFKTLDFEAATEGEYWLVLRGLLLLYRDAMNKKLTSHGKLGIGGGEPQGIGGGAPTREIRLQQDMFVEPSSVGRLEKLVVKLRKLNDDYIRGAIMPGAIPPPSDYFLGFKSPGTQIWSRLRWAGFETQRVFSADPRKVMIKIRCPEDRLTDVAEVLRLKIKTKDGSYAPFHEDAAHIFESTEDLLDIPKVYRDGMASLLRSKDRQTIIDFIIGSRIRDSGAELSQMNQVGKMIQAKVPLHMPQKLESLYNAWVCYWKREHWTGIEDSESSIGESSIGGIKNLSAIEEGNFQMNDQSSTKDRRPVPSFLTRVFVEAFNQPLDAIEDYFGEQVTFYFAWMQHCSIHLSFLAFFGMVVTFCQVLTDGHHWLRPWFSLTVMIWTFLTLINWRKRSNSLAYKWGSMDYKHVETTRPEFYGTYMRDPITDEWVIKYPRWKRWLKYMISFPISMVFAGLALFLILFVHANRDAQMQRYIESKYNSTTLEGDLDFSISWTYIIGNKELQKVPVNKDVLTDPKYWIIMITLPSLLGLCIPILNVILMNLAMALNNFENYQTDAEYRTHLISKVFTFRFVSQFGTVYYYAFIAAAVGTAEAFENGMIRMGTSLIIYTTVAHWWNIFLQVYVFMAIRNIRHHFYHKRLRKELKNIELLEEEHISNERCDAEVREIKLLNKRILLDQAQDPIWMEVMCPPHDSFPEYITAVIQFSFVACFSVVLPW